MQQRHIWCAGYRSKISFESRGWGKYLEKKVQGRRFWRLIAKGIFSAVIMFFHVCPVLLKLPELLREATEGFLAGAGGIKDLTGFQVRKPKYDLKNLS